MKIRIYGSIDRPSRTEIKEAAEFFARRLMHTNLVKHLKITIKVRKTYDAAGTCDVLEDKTSPREFEIVLRNSPEDPDPIASLAHEMVHVKQFAKNELSTSGMLVASRGRLVSTSKWNGVVWIPRKNDSQYYDSPWELEAYGKEVGLIHAWRNR